MPGDTTLDGLIRDAFAHLMTDVRVSLPGKIETFNADRTATVQPMISRKFKGAAVGTKLPVIQNVPIVEARTQKAIAHLPIGKGDPVLLVFSDRAIGNWLGSAGVIPVLPLDVRQHDIADAFGILGGWPTLQKGITPGSSTAAGITVKPGTPLYLGNGTEELVSIMSEMIDLIIANNYIGNLGFPTAGMIPPQIIEWLLLQGRLDTLKA